MSPPPDQSETLGPGVGGSGWDSRGFPPAPPLPLLAFREIAAAAGKGPGRSGAASVTPGPSGTQKDQTRTHWEQKRDPHAPSGTHWNQPREEPRSHQNSLGAGPGRSRTHRSPYIRCCLLPHAGSWPCWAPSAGAGRWWGGCASSSAVMGKNGAAVPQELCPWARAVPGVVLPPDPTVLGVCSFRGYWGAASQSMWLCGSWG